MTTEPANYGGADLAQQVARLTGVRLGADISRLIEIADKCVEYQKHMIRADLEREYAEKSKR